MHHSNFVHLHLHTQYSLLDGMIRPDELLRLAREYRMPAVAMTDHGNMFGAVDFYHKAMSSGIKPIIGAEVYVATGKRTEKTGASKDGREERSHHLVLLVKDTKGYKNLCKLLTLGYLEGFYYRPRVDKELLSIHNEGLIALSACMHGEVPYLVNTGQIEKAQDAAAFYKGIFNDRFYLEIQHNGIEEQKKINSGLLELSKRMDIPLVATNDCHYLRKDDARFHDILLCIQTGKTVMSRERLRFPTNEFYFKSPDEMASAFSHVPDAIRNTIVIAERCNLELNLSESHLPDFPLPEGETLDSFLSGKAMVGLEARLAVIARTGVDTGPLKRHYYDRLKKELAVIKGMGFSGYFLIVLDFIEHAKSRSIPVGPGRGSAAGSLVAFSLGIIDLDPIRYNLLFERFLNPDRISLPDIDIDFCIEGREDVIRYVSEKYGADNVTQIISFGQMKAKAVIRDVGRALDMSYSDVDRIAKLVPNQLNITISEAIEKEPMLLGLMESDPRVRELMDVAKRLEGLPRHASTHAAGVVISNKPLVEYLPLYKGQKENIVTTQYSMYDVEKIGLAKFDFLGLKTLTVINDTVKAVKETYGIEIKFEDMGADDPATYALLSRANTNGVFQLEGSGMKEILRKLKPSTFEDIMAAVALYRPGPLRSGMVDDFIRRKHGIIPIVYEVPELEAILETTYGVMLYQEQVMEIARALAGFTPGDADVLRRAMGKKKDDRMAEQCTKFVEGAKKKNIPVHKAEKIFDLMAKFAGYGFNKSHSAAYAIIAYRTAYLKAHYQAEFMAALLTSEMDDGDKVTRYINELKDMGIEVLAPDLNESQIGFKVMDKRIRFGLGAVKNVGKASVEAVIAARKEKRFDS
ncbi:MAG: DNA polymerase III subunit alpha, partial [Deltaproteobacteria bacterium]|nr:DNA polymerase III subunit alpha [Deltaproteobacteria bacterium]